MTGLGGSESRDMESDEPRSSDSASHADHGNALGFDFPSILQIADSLPVMVAYCDRDQVYRFCNRPIADWFERPREAILGRTLAEVMGPGAYALRKDAVAAALAGERQWFAAEFLHPTRGPLTTQASYIPQMSKDGSVAGVIMIVEDVTEQRAAESALRESEARFRRIANSAPAPMWVTRSDGSRDFVNQAFLDFFGFPREEVGHHDWVKAGHPDDVDDFVANYAKGLESGVPFELECRFRRHDGEWRWMRTGSTPRLDSERRVIGYIGVASDVTDAKLAEAELRREVEDRTHALEMAQDQLRQSQKMEALGQLTGGIAHDFNNLLTVVVGGLDLILKRSDDDKVRRYAQNALASAERGARLTGQLLAFSRVQRLEIRPTGVTALIENMRPMLRNVLGPGIEKKFALDHGSSAVRADPTQLEVAILNLAINARDAMSGGGILSISTRTVSIDEGDAELEPGDYLELAITDTGSGMAPDVAARVFEPFFTTKEVGKGTGLGLSMVYGMARQSGGTARIESEVGKGTTVRLFFQTVEEEGDSSAEAEPDRARPKRSKRPSVLLVDDDQDVRAFVAASLEENGYRVTHVADGPSALAEANEQDFDIIVIDFLMPRMTGAEVAAAIRERRPNQKILFVSGYSETEAIRAAAPDAALLTKPFRPEALDRAIRDLLSA